jgi:hypothetical protein
MCSMSEWRKGETNEGRLDGDDREEEKKKVAKSIEEKKRDDNVAMF